MPVYNDDLHKYIYKTVFDSLIILLVLHVEQFYQKKNLKITSYYTSYVQLV